MKKNTRIALFEGKTIRRLWDEEKELWYFSVIDVVGILTGSSIPRRYWSDLKIKLKNEGSQVYEKIVQLKFMSQDGKYYTSDSADTETMFRIIQSIPSPKAEPFKLWLSRVGYERVEEAEDPEKAIPGIRTKDYKKFKDLKKENLRDNMTNLEMVLNMLAETSTTEISKVKKPKTFIANRQVAREGGSIAGGARKQLEKRLKRPIVARNNYLKESKKQEQLED